MQTSYLQHVFDPARFAKSVDKTLSAAERLKKCLGFDTIAFTGMSGAAMAFLLSHWMGVPLLCVRKKTDSSHYVNSFPPRYLEGNVVEVRKYLIIDDFIASGASVRYMIDTIKEQNYSAECVGMLLYAAYSDNQWTHPDTRKSYPTTSSRVDD